MGIRWRALVMVGLGLAVGTCASPVERRNVETQPTNVASEDVQTEAATRPVVVVDVDRPWMKWGEARPDSGRGRNRTDPTRYWSDARVLEMKPAVTASTAPATREAVPKPVEPGSRVGSGAVVPEPADVLGK